ncbi:MAG: HypC/HybG/HupF family hydrogenase formation chaperone [Syntrophomonadaceae bacterium]|jgi:hydrogenase expression/formation protein HypC|nr:HypC/HybG/HupF family hydrogenase formation chaperone [Syntrophomonadaceae bacterium]
MCLGVPGRIVSIEANRATADINGNQVEVSIIMTPEVVPGQYVLIHAGFAMQIIDESEARETMDWLLALQKIGEAYEN